MGVTTSLERSLLFSNLVLSLFILAIGLSFVTYATAENSMVSNAADPKNKPNDQKAQIEQLFQSVISSDIQSLSDYLSSGGNKDVVGSMGMTPLALAVQVNKRKAIDLFLMKGANIHTKDNNGWGLLHFVSSVPVAKILLKKGLSLEAVDNEGNTPLHTASTKEIAQFFIAKGLSINTRSAKGRTALHTASQLGNTETVTFLLAKNADVNARDQYGKTPLFLADQTDVVKLLLDHQADVSARDSLGQTILHRPLDKKTMSAFIRKGADVSARDFKGQTPLHVVGLRAWESKDVAELLISKGANIEARDLAGNAALHKVESLAVATLLLDKGAHLYVKNNAGKTPLELASMRSNQALVNLFSDRLGVERITVKKTAIETIDRTSSTGSLQQKLDNAIAEKLAEKEQLHTKQSAPMGPPSPKYAAALVITPRFEAAGSFHMGSAPVKMDGKWGLIDEKGEWILAPTFTEIGKYTQEGLLPVKAADKYGYIDASGASVTGFIYDAVKAFSEGLAAVKVKDEWGYILPDNKWYMKPGFEGAGSFKQGVAPIKFAEGWGYALREWGEGVTGQDWLLEPIYQRTYEFSEGHGVFKLDNKMGLVDTKKNILIKPKYSNMKKYSDGMLPVSLKTGQWFYVDNKDNVVIDEKYTAASSFSEGLASVKKKGKWGYIDKNNQTIIPFQYDRAYDFHEGVAVAVKGEDRLFIDKTGKVLSESYADVYRVTEGYAPVKVGDKWGYVFIHTASAVKSE